MDNAVRKFISRAPRYVLRPGDNSFLRYAFEGEKDHSYSTRFLNISVTGLAFLVDQESSPLIGEQIKVEFTVPTGERLAWFAEVVRLERLSETDRIRFQLSNDDEIVVGVRFEALPDGHSVAIKQALNEKFLEMLRERRRENFKQFLHFILFQYGRVLIYIFLGLMTFSLLYFLSLPSGNYIKDRGSQWGERFK